MWRRSRNYHKYLGRRGGYTSGYSSRNFDKNPQLYNGTPFRVDGNTVRPDQGISRRPTGGRFTGKSGPSQSPDPAIYRRSRRRPNNALDKVTHDGPVLPWPMPPIDYGKPYYPTSIPVHIDFGIKRKRVRAVAAGSTYSYSTLFSPRRVSKTKEARMLNKFAPTQSAEYLISIRTETDVGTQNYIVQNTAGIGTMDDLVSGNPAVLGPKTADLWLRRVNQSLMMTNNSNANAFVEIWEGYYRRSCIDPASTFFRQGLTDQGAVGPPNFTQYPDLNYRMDPLKSRYFSQFCRVTNVTSVELGEGRSHCHNSKYYANVKWNNEIFQQYNTPGIAYIGGLSRFVMIIARGAPINDTGTSNTNVSTARVALDMVFSMKYSYFYNTPNTATTFISNTLPSITSPEVVNVATGAGTANTKY